MSEYVNLDEVRDCFGKIVPEEMRGVFAKINNLPTIEMKNITLTPDPDVEFECHTEFPDEPQIKKALEG